MYEVRVLAEASRDLEKIDKSVAQRIVRRIQWLADNLDMIRPEALTGDLSGLFRFRVGDYRVIYEIIHSEMIIVIHYIGHRREIYRIR